MCFSSLIQSILRTFNKVCCFNLNGVNGLTILASLNLVVMLLVTDAIGIDLNEVDLNDYTTILAIKLFYIFAIAIAYYGMWSGRIWLITAFVVAQFHFLIRIVFPFCLKDFQKTVEMTTAAIKSVNQDFKSNHSWTMYFISFVTSQVQLILVWLPVAVQLIFIVITIRNILYFYWKKRQARQVRFLISDLEDGFIAEEDVLDEMIGDDEFLTVGNWHHAQSAETYHFNINPTFNDSEFMKPYV